MLAQKDKEILELICAEKYRARGYADFFGWSLDRDIEEWGIVTNLAESMEIDGKVLFTNLKRRGRGNDPPDCEALDNNGRRIAIEVTELVDGKAIKDYKSSGIYKWADWNKSKFISFLESILSRKDSRYPKLKEPPYEGGYIVVIFTDEPMLNRSVVASYLQGHVFKMSYITRAFLLMSYDPEIKRCPYYELTING